MSEVYSFVKQLDPNEDYYLKGKKVGKRFKQNAHILLIHIHSLCQRENGVCNATSEYFCKIMGKQRRQVTYYLQYLRETGQIHVHTSAAKREINRFGGVKFYKKRLIQSYHDHKPDHYDTVNELFFKAPEKIKTFAKKMEFAVKTHKVLVDYKGRILPPERVGYETPEFFKEKLDRLFPDQKGNAIIQEQVKIEPKVELKESVSIEDLDSDPDFIMFKKNRVVKEPDEIIDEPDPGNELRDLRERLRKKREEESEKFWQELDKEEEEKHEPLNFSIKLNLKIPYRK
jgi:hypothetical protein